MQEWEEDKLSLESF